MSDLTKLTLKAAVDGLKAKETKPREQRPEAPSGDFTDPARA